MNKTTEALKLAEQDHFAAPGKPIAEPVKQEPVAYGVIENGVPVSWMWNPEFVANNTDARLALYAAPVDAKAIREERDSMWLAQMEFEEKRVRAEALEEAANKAWDVAPSDEAAEKIAAAIRGLK
jgi:hypothetical protein